MCYFGYCSIIIYYFPLGLLARFSILGWQDITGIIMPLTQTLEGKKTKKTSFLEK